MFAPLTEYTTPDGREFKVTIADAGLEIDREWYKGAMPQDATRACESVECSDITVGTSLIMRGFANKIWQFDRVK